MIIVGITGPISHGKTTLGQLLQELEPKSVHYESAEVIAGLAEAWLAIDSELPNSQDIKAINNWLQKLVPFLNKSFGLDCTFLQIKIDRKDVAQHPEHYQKLFDFLAQPKSNYSSITEANKTYFRPLLQWMGGYFVAKVDFGIWYKQILKRIKHDQSKGIDLATVGGLRYPEDAAILKSAGAVVIAINRPSEAEADLSDPTERERQSIPVDCTVINNGSLDDLEACAARFYDDLKQGLLKNSYLAK